MSHNEKTISSFLTGLDDGFKASIFEEDEEINRIVFEIYNVDVDLNCNANVDEIEEHLKTNFSFALNIEHAYLLRDFLNYALPDKI